MSTIPLLPCALGIDNVHDASHGVFQPKLSKDGAAPPECVTELLDLDLSSDGDIQTRAGVVSVRTLTSGRRLFYKGGMTLSQSGTTLSLENLTAKTAQTLLTGLSSVNRLIAHEWPTGGDRAFLSDGVLKFAVRVGVVKPWGLPVPSALAVARIAGALPAASYLVVATHRTGSLTAATALESGAVRPIRHTLTAAGGLRLSLVVSDTNITHVAFYCSRPDQAEPMLAAVVAVAAGSATLDLTTETQLRATETPLVRQGWGPPLTGITAIGSLQAFMLAAVGSALYRSWPGDPGLFRYGREVQMFPATITGIVGLQDGAWVGTAKGLYWMAGEAPPSWRRVLVDSSPVLPEGTRVPGAVLPKLQTDVPVAAFVTEHGVVAGLPGGQIIHLTRDRYHFTTATRVSIAYTTGDERRLFIAVT